MYTNIYQELFADKQYPRHLGGQNIPQSSGAYSMIDLTSNDYLGVNHHPSIKSELQNWLIEYLQNNSWDVGATGSRLISGNHPIFEAFEADIAKAKHQSAALLFNSGYQANSGVLAALLKAPNTYAVMDKFNHASLYQAVQNAQINTNNHTQYRYPHLNYTALAQKLEKIPQDANKWIITETVFGMDGDSVNLHKVVELAKKYHAHLYLDEAHATGIFGQHGYGLTTEANILPALAELRAQGLEVCIMGTFGKALGTAGAYLACSDLLKNYLVNYCGSFIYSTAASPLLMALSHHIWQQLPLLHQKHAAHILNSAEEFRSTIKQIIESHHMPCQILGDTHISVLRMNDAKASSLAWLKSLNEKLRAHHIYPSIILPPTTPLPSLRFAFCAMHSKEDVAFILKTMIDIMPDIMKNIMMDDD